MQAPRKPRGWNNGFALITTIFMIVIFFILIGLMMDNLNNEIQATGMHGRSNAAVRAAYLGVEEMQYQFELNDAGAAPGQTPPPQNKTYTDTDGTQVSYSVTVDPQQWPVTPPYWLIHAVGTAGNATRKVDALLQKQPYSAYSLFTISEQNNVGGAVWYAQGESFNGPVYSGGPMRIDYVSGATPPPIFGSTVTTAANPIWAPGKPTTPADWSAIISTQANFVQVSSALTLPSASDNSAVQDAAFTGNPNPAATPAFPATTGLYINGANVTGGGGGALTSGLYIAGDAYVTSAAAGTTNTFTFNIFPTSCAPIATCVGPPLTYNVIVDYSAGTTTVTNALMTAIATYTGVPSGQQPFGVTGPNGAIWATQGMWLNAGNKFEGKYTFAVPDAQGLGNPNIYMAGSQTYLNPSQDELAYWANDIVLWDTISANIEIDGLLLTGYYGECSVVCTNGTFKNHFCTAAPLCIGSGIGVLTLNGSLIENVRGKRGTLGTLSGFSTDVVYDPRLARTPPPFTPSTTQFNVIAICTVDFGKTCGQ